MKLLNFQVTSEIFQIMAPDKKMDRMSVGMTAIIVDLHWCVFSQSTTFYFKFYFACEIILTSHTWNARKPNRTKCTWQQHHWRKRMEVLEAKCHQTKKKKGLCEISGVFPITCRVARPSEGPKRKTPPCNQIWRCLMCSSHLSTPYGSLHGHYERSRTQHSSRGEENVAPFTWLS